MQVLVVDNDDTIRSFMQLHLEEAGHQIKIAQDGLSALKLLKSFSPDIIFIDLIMPNIDGKKLCQMLRKDKKFDNTFLVVLSAISSEEQINYQKYGFNASIAKGPLKIVGDHVTKIIEKLTDSKEAATGLSFEIKNLSQRGITKELLSTKRHFELILSNMSECIFELTPDGTIIYINEAALKIFSVKEEEVLAQPFISLFDENQKHLISNMLNEIHSAKTMRHMHPPIRVLDQLLTFDLLAIIDDGRKSMFAILNNRTDQLRAEEILLEGNRELEKRVTERTKEIAMINESLRVEVRERKVAEKEIQSALKEKELLLKEVHHRVKNNLQVITSLIGLQARQIHDKKLKEKFIETQNRILSISTVHEKLYQSKKLSKIDIDDYITKIMSNLISSFGEMSVDIQIKRKIEQLQLGIDIAIPCGLILNELISNAIKHAFPEKQKGIIEIRFQKTGNKHYTLSVRDNGKGIEENRMKQKPGTLGLKIIKTLAKQLSGTIELNTTDGTEFNIEFPVPVY